MVDPKKWTTKTNEAIASAMQLATTNSNPELTPDHVLIALTSQTDTVVPALLAKLGIAASMLHDRAQVVVNGMPRAHGGSEPRMSRELSQVFAAAEQSQKDLHDDYLSVEHLLLALHTRVGVSGEEMLQALRDVRGSHRVTSQNPEEQFQSLEKYGVDLTQRARDGKIDPVIDAMKKFAA